MNTNVENMMPAEAINALHAYLAVKEEIKKLQKDAEFDSNEGSGQFYDGLDEAYRTVLELFENAGI